MGVERRRQATVDANGKVTAVAVGNTDDHRDRAADAGVKAERADHGVT